jgi:hypothetical protein
MHFEPIQLTAETTTGEYRVERTSTGGWSAQWIGAAPYLNGMPTQARVVAIDARDALGACDWESRELAETACRLHERYMAQHSPSRAAELVACDYAEAASLPDHDGPLHLSEEWR